MVCFIKKIILGSLDQETNALTKKPTLHSNSANYGMKVKHSPENHISRKTLACSKSNYSFPVK